MAQKIILFLNRWIITITCVFVFFQTLFFQQISPDAGLFFKSTDSYWLIRMGEWILQNKCIPFTNVLGHPFLQIESIHWVCYQWLFSVLLALLNKISGIHGMVLVFSCLNAIVIALLGYSLHLRKFRHFPEIGFSLLPITAFLLINIDLRPAIFSILFCSVLNILLINKEKANSRYLWFLLPLIFMVWANIHLGFIFGILWLLVEVSFWSIKNKSIKPFILWILCFLSTFLNPRGYALYSYLFTLGNSSFMNANIAELQHYNFFADYSNSFFILLGIASFIFTLKLNNIRNAERIMMVLSFIMYMFSVRHLTFMLIFLPVFYSSSIKQILGRKPEQLSYIFHENYKTFSHLLIIFIAGSILCLFKIYPVPALPKNINRTFIEYINKNPVSEPILAGGDAGSELLYFTNSRSYIDTRFDMYGDDYVKKYTEIYTQQGSWTENLKKNNIKYVLYDKKIGRENFSYLERTFQQLGWKVLYKDSELLFLSK